MKEELYVYDSDGNRLQADLGGDTKITLKWENNLFKSIDKVSCSYSYTFKIPTTRRNSIVFDLAEDVRHKSRMAWKKLKAEFIQNGIPLFRNANLYINKYSSQSYQCVFTWGVLEGLQKLSDDGVSLQDLRSKLLLVSDTYEETNASSYTYWGDKDGDATPDYGDYSEFDNMLQVLHPNYMAGYGQIDTNLLAKKAPLPVMPTKYILDCINKAYGINIQLGTEYSGTDATSAITKFTKDKLYDDENIVSFGAVPFVKAELTDKQMERNVLRLSYKEYYPDVTILDTKKVIGFNLVDNTASGTDLSYILPAYGKVSTVASLGYSTGSVSGVPSNDEMTAGTYITTTKPTGSDASDWAIIGFYSRFEVKIKGMMVVRVEDAIKYEKESGELKDDTLFHIKIRRLSVKDTYKDYDEYGNSKVWEIEDETTINNASSEDKTTFYSTNVRDSDGNFQYAQYFFDFNPDDGYDAVSCGNEGPLHEMDGHDGHFYFFCFENSKVKSIVRASEIVIEPQINDAKKLTHEMDTFTNLPDIDCLDFVKSLFYAMGEYPYVDANGAIRGVGYKYYEDCIENGDIVDWSKKLTGSANDAPEEISYVAGDFKQKNYYLSKWDDLDRTEEELEDEEEVYEDGIGCITSDNDTLQDEQTVYTFPFYAPFVLYRKQPKMWTGDSVKFWEWDYPDVTYKECKPAYGILTTEWPMTAKPFSYDSTTYVITQSNIVINGSKIGARKQMLMYVFNPFGNIKDNPNYAYLQRIVRNPIQITENFYLNEIDLANLDMRKPVYIRKYGSYFAIITIQRNANGVCKCELLRLPPKIKVTITFSASTENDYRVHFKSTHALTYPLDVELKLHTPDDEEIIFDCTVPVGETDSDIYYGTGHTYDKIESAEIVSQDEDDENEYTLTIGE